MTGRTLGTAAATLVLAFLAAYAASASAQDGKKAVLVGLPSRWKAGEIITRSGTSVTKIDPGNSLHEGLVRIRDEWEYLVQCDEVDDEHGFVRGKAYVKSWESVPDSNGNTPDVSAAGSVLLLTGESSRRIDGPHPLTEYALTWLGAEFGRGGAGFSVTAHVAPDTELVVGAKSETSGAYALESATKTADGLKIVLESSIDRSVGKRAWIMKSRLAGVIDAWHRTEQVHDESKWDVIGREIETSRDTKSRAGGTFPKNAAKRAEEAR